MRKSTMKVRGFGGDVRVVCGEVALTATIGEEEFPIRFYVVPNEAIDMQVLIGMDFLSGVDYSISPGEVRVKKYRPSDAEPADVDVKWIRRVAEYVAEDEVTVPYQYRDEVLELIENYTPEKPVVAANQLTITLSDNDVARRAADKSRQLKFGRGTKSLRPRRAEFGLAKRAGLSRSPPPIVAAVSFGSYALAVVFVRDQ
ncbi:hypothetical protein pipiens_000031, partial [Culex pipiens pipiens]